MKSPVSWYQEAHQLAGTKERTSQRMLRKAQVIGTKEGTTLSAATTLSGRIGKVDASHAAVARSIPLRCTDLYYARGAQGVLPMRVGVRPVNWIYRL